MNSSSFLYHKIQQEHGWGAKVVEQLAHDLRLEFPGLEGNPKHNLLYMRQFKNAYPKFPISQAPLDQISRHPTAFEHSWSRDVIVHDV